MQNPRPADPSSPAPPSSGAPGAPGALWRGILSAPLDHDLPIGHDRYRRVLATPGLVVEHRRSGFLGRVVGPEGDGILLRGFSGKERLGELVPGGFKVDGEVVTLELPEPVAAPPAPGVRTASGSRAAEHHDARVARPSRILVEGKHDAELVERIWGDDLRAEGIVVECLDGLDRLPAYVRAFAPADDRRLGVLCDHLVAGSKEARIAAGCATTGLLVCGTPYIDVWQAVRPQVLGLDAWPVIPPGRPWKEGICAELGFAEPYELWRRLLAAVRSWDDVETPLVTAVETLIDFVTAAA